jgi:peptide-methionine (R)-S-oxide reductase
MKNKEEAWKKKLSPEEYHVLREKGTEAPFSGKFVKFDKKGEFVCKACGNVIFDSKTKFDSGCGWPSFYSAREGSVKLKTDTSHGMIRKEVVCSKCGSHLGHVFREPLNGTPTGKRFCINSVALGFGEEGEKS